MVNIDKAIFCDNCSSYVPKAKYRSHLKAHTIEAIKRNHIAFLEEQRATVIETPKAMDVDIDIDINMDIQETEEKEINLVEQIYSLNMIDDLKQLKAKVTSLIKVEIHDTSVLLDEQAKASIDFDNFIEDMGLSKDCKEKKIHKVNELLKNEGGTINILLEAIMRT
ncbi:hypothetical protein BDB01DRAFT_799586 [Pilobolus umbonatus]|nr:hypothetical protein BDB01DRAFT_799586 [Pilobolus umbonatus]